MDVFAEPFPRDAAYTVYAGRKVDVLLLKLERLNEAAGEAFREFLGLPEFRLVRRNEAEGKVYAETYRAFQRRVRFPAPLLERIYSSDFVRRFYSEEESAAFAGRWARP